MGNELTEKQNIIFNFIRSVISDTGFPPTVREIAERFEMTAKGAYDHLKAIEKKGFIRCGQNKSRAIEILVGRNDEDGKISVPLLGSIAAGLPILAEENIEDYVQFPESAMGSGSYFALRVRGESMIGAGICNGDIALFRVQNIAENGDIVAALIDGEATLKRFSRKGDEISLLAENPAFASIKPDNLSILGKIAAILRIY